MFGKKRLLVMLAAVAFACSAGLARTLEDDWNDFLHYTAIYQEKLAKGYARAILDSSPDPVELLALSEKNAPGYALLLRAKENKYDAELAELSGRLWDVIERGRFLRRSDPKIVIEEVDRLSRGDRAKHTAVKRLRNSGEYSIPYMLEVLADPSRKAEWSNIVWALPQIEKDAIRPLAAALQTDNVSVKLEIVRALGGIRYPQALPYLKYVIEKEQSAQLRSLAEESINQIDPAALGSSAAQLFYQSAEKYYYHAESLRPAEDADFGNVWFWDSAAGRLIREKVDRSYFNELMAMRECEWALKADPGFGQAIGLWLASYLKAESSNVSVPAYFGEGHADAFVYATTAGPEYLHQALARAVKDKNAYVALGSIEALAITAGEKSLFYSLGGAQPLVQALTFDDKAVRYSAAIAIGAAGPQERFAEHKLVVRNLAEALAETPESAGENTATWNAEMANSYALRAAGVMLKLAQTRNPAIDLSAAQSALIDATGDRRMDIQILAGQILAHLNSPDAQRSIAAMALNESNDMGVRISAFESLAVSAKINANLLDGERIDAIYALVSSLETDPALRSAAAAAYGALNLPSQKVKTLILDQSRN